MLYINMLAIAAVDVILLDNEARIEYENGGDSFFAYRWGRRVSIDETVEVDAGTWYIVVEGRDEPSRGHLKVFQQ